MKRMIDEAADGKIEVYERPHVLCLFRDKNDKIQIMEVSDEDLNLLQNLEDGPQTDKNFLEKKQEDLYKKFTRNGLILDLISN